VRGTDHLLRGIEKQLEIESGDTSTDGRYSLRCARCVGACGIAPVLVIDDDVHGEVVANRVKKIIRQYK